jgi:hypothetical protein
MRFALNKPPRRRSIVKHIMMQRIRVSLQANRGRFSIGIHHKVRDNILDWVWQCIGLRSRQEVNNRERFDQPNHNVSLFRYDANSNLIPIRARTKTLSDAALLFFRSSAVTVLVRRFRYRFDCVWENLDSLVTRMLNVLANSTCAWESKVGAF